VAVLVPLLLAAYLVVWAVLIFPWQGDATGLGRAVNLGFAIGLAAGLSAIARGFSPPFRRLLRDPALPRDQRRQALGVGLLLALSAAPIIVGIVMEVPVLGPIGGPPGSAYPSGAAATKSISSSTARSSGTSRSWKLFTDLRIRRHSVAGSLAPTAAQTPSFQG
jgi:hypothetical protein